MADATRTLEIVLNAKDEASRVIKSFGDQFGNLVNNARAGAAVIAGTLGLAATSIVKTAADFEQARVAYNGFLGDVEKGGVILQQLSDFATKTPFDLPQVVEGGKRLLAMGVEADNLVDTFRKLGDLSQGQGEKLNQLILAFGQVKAATKLTGAELRQFTEAGIPLLDGLVQELNKNGGAMVKVGGAAKKTKVDVGELNDKLAISKQRLKEATEAGKAKQSTMMSLKNTVQNYEQKITEASAANATMATSMKRVKVTAADVKEMISDGAISFEQVEAALNKMTGEGGRFFQAMDLQSKTFAGTMRNAGDELIRFSLALLGMDTKGDIREGSIFFYLKNAANLLLQALQTLRPMAQQFVDSILNNSLALKAILGALIGLLVPLTAAFIGLIAPAVALSAIGAGLVIGISAFIDAIREGNPLVIGLTASLASLAVVMLTRLIPAFTAWAAAAISSATAVIVAMAPVLVPIALIGVAVGLLAAAWKNNWLNIRNIVESVVNWFKSVVMPFFETEFGKKMLQIIDVVTLGMVSKFKMVKDTVMGVVDAIKSVISWSQSLSDKVKSGLKVPGFQHGGFVEGGASTAVPAILHGGERVIPRNGVDVNGGGSGGVNIQISFTGPVSMDSTDRVDDLARRVINILGRQNELAAKGLAI